MEEKDRNAITNAFLEVLEKWDAPLMPLQRERISKVLELTSPSIESSKMQFEIPITITENGMLESQNLNTQLGDECPNSYADFRLCRLLTNYRTRYDPSWAIRAVRRYKERNYRDARRVMRKDNEKEMKSSHLEVVGRIARNDPLIQKIMEESYNKGFRYSAMGCLSFLYRSEKLDHQLWINIPILGIPGAKITDIEGLAKLLHPIKAEDAEEWNSAIPEIIKDFGKAYQMPERELLENGEYVYIITRTGKTKNKVNII